MKIKQQQQNAGLILVHSQALISSGSGLESE
jgi:hypothetical protein